MEHTIDLPETDMVFLDAKTYSLAVSGTERTEMEIDFYHTHLPVEFQEGELNVVFTVGAPWGMEYLAVGSHDPMTLRDLLNQTILQVDASEIPVGLQPYRELTNTWTRRIRLDVVDDDRIDHIVGWYNDLRQTKQLVPVEQPFFFQVVWSDLEGRLPTEPDYSHLTDLQPILGGPVSPTGRLLVQSKVIGGTTKTNLEHTFEQREFGRVTLGYPVDLIAPLELSVTDFREVILFQENWGRDVEHRPTEGVYYTPGGEEIRLVELEFTPEAFTALDIAQLYALFQSPGQTRLAQVLIKRGERYPDDADYDQDQYPQPLISAVKSH